MDKIEKGVDMAQNLWVSQGCVYSIGLANVGEQVVKTIAARLVRMWSKISQKNFGT